MTPRSSKGFASKVNIWSISLLFDLKLPDDVDDDCEEDWEGAVFIVCEWDEQKGE